MCRDQTHDLCSIVEKLRGVMRQKNLEIGSHLGFWRLFWIFFSDSLTLGPKLLSRPLLSNWYWKRNVCIKLKWKHINTYARPPTKRLQHLVNFFASNTVSCGLWLEYLHFCIFNIYMNRLEVVLALLRCKFRIFITLKMPCLCCGRRTLRDNHFVPHSSGGGGGGSSY